MHRFFFLVFSFSLLVFFGCEKKPKEKFGVHDHPVFLQNCENALLTSIFEKPYEDPFREKHLCWLKEHHQKLFAYAEQHRENPSRDLVLAATLAEKFSIGSETSIIFIGAEDGSLPRLFHEVFHVQKMTVIDLKPCLARAQKQSPKSPVQWITPQEINKPLQADLIVSCDAFSHLSQEWQKALFHMIFTKARGGGFFYQPAPRHWGVKSWKKDRLLQNLRRQFQVDTVDAKFLTDDTSSIILFAR